LPPLLPPSTGTTFYVDGATGDDHDAGTSPATAWKTIQRALDTLRPGQRALVRGGTYAENLFESSSGTPLAPITVAAYPGETVVLKPASTSGDTYAAEITGSYFRLHGFVLEDATGLGADVYLEDHANHIEISGNEIRYSHDQGLFADPGTSSIFVVGNRIHDNGLGHDPGQHQSHGIYFEGTHDLIADNAIYNQPYGFGIQLYPGNTDSVVVENTVVANGFSGIVLGGDGGVADEVVRENIFADNGAWGIATDSTCPVGPVLADHNVVYGNPSGGIQADCPQLVTAGGNIAADPLFADLAARNLHLLAGSPAIDAGLLAWSEPFDLDGVARPQGAGPDIGAFER
jgi:hypothetical protein